jgi:tetratricopeptide (TPR) repeat protein
MRAPATLVVLLCGLAAAVGCSRVDHAQRGSEYVAAGQVQEAIIEYRNAVNDEPNNGDLRLRLARLYAQVGDGRSAMAEYVRAADILPDNVEAQLESAQYYVVSGQFEDARARAERVLALEPGNVDALLARGTAMAGLRDLQGAVSEFQEVLTLDPSNSSGYKNVGAIQMSQGKREEAEATFRKAVEMAPQSVPARQALANFLWSTGKRDDAETELKAALALEPANRGTNTALGILYLTAGRAPEAEPYFTFIAKSADTTETWLALSDYYQITGRMEEARKVLNDMLERPDGFAPATVRLAALNAREGMRVQAEARLRALLEKQPKDAPALLLNARLLFLDGKRDEALAGIKQTLAAAPSMPIAAAAHLVAGDIYKALDRHADAVGEYEAVLTIDSRPLGALMALAGLEMTSGDPAAATKYADAAYALAPEDPQVQALLVRARMRDNKLAEAKEQLKTLQDKFPNSAQVVDLTAMTQLLDQQVEAARTSYVRALQLAPSDFEALNGLSEIDLRTGRGLDARKRIDQHLATDEPTVDLLVLAARIYARTDDADKAEALLEQAVDLDPLRLVPYNLLAQLYVRQNRVEAAIGQLRKIQERNPDSVPAATLLGMMYEVQKRLPEAEQQYRLALTHDRRAAVAANNLAWLYVSGNRDLDTALQLAQDAKQQIPDEPIINDTLGWIYYRKEMTNQAISSLEASVARSPDQPMFQYHLGMAYLQYGNIQKARASLQQALSLGSDFEGATDAQQTLARLTN